VAVATPTTSDADRTNGAFLTFDLRVVVPPVDRSFGVSAVARQTAPAAGNMDDSYSGRYSWRNGGVAYACCETMREATRPAA